MVEEKSNTEEKEKSNIKQTLNTEEKKEQKLNTKEEEEKLIIANMLLDSYRLNKERLNLIDPTVLAKVNTYIMQPLRRKLVNFLKNRRNRVAYNIIKQHTQEALENKLPLNEYTRSMAVWLSTRLLLTSNNIMEAYFITRMLKKVGSKTPARPEVGLSAGDNMTHIIAYFGFHHIFNITNILTKMGFIVIAQGKDKNTLNALRETPSQYEQFILYSEIKNIVNRFCS